MAILISGCISVSFVSYPLLAGFPDAIVSADRNPLSAAESSNEKRKSLPSPEDMGRSEMTLI